MIVSILNTKIRGLSRFSPNSFKSIVCRAFGLMKYHGYYKLHYDGLKSIVPLTCIYPNGLLIQEGMEFDTKLVRKMEIGESAVFAGETMNARDGSLRIGLADGTGFGSIFAVDGTALLSPPPTPAVETTTDSPLITSVVLRINSHRFLASYRATLKKLGFKTNLATNSSNSYPSILAFDHPTGVDRSSFLSVFEPLVNDHLKKYYNYPKPKEQSSESWHRYELWMEYKEEISIFAE